MSGSKRISRPSLPDHSSRQWPVVRLC